MRPGKVVNIRVNPTDCLGVLDVARKVGVDCTNSSFPQIVSLTLSTLLQSARNAQQIPIRMGYEYEEEMAPYIVDDKSKRKLKLQRANEIHLQGSDFQMPGLETITAQPQTSNKQSPPETPRAASGAEVPTLTREEAAGRLTYLLGKKDMADDGKVSWTEKDQSEYNACYNIIYPEG